MINDKLYEEVFNKIYPIGSIYISTSNTNPSTLFGGTWVQIKDTFLLSAGDTYTAGNSGGASSVNYTPNGNVENHTLTIDEMPSHNHDMQHQNLIVYSGGNSGGLPYSPSSAPFQPLVTASKGGDQPHNHGFTGTQATINTMPPYLVVYIWKRTA